MHSFLIFMIKKKGIILIIYFLFSKYLYNIFKKVFTRWLLLLFIICIALTVSTKLIFWTVNEKIKVNSPFNFNSSITPVCTVTSFIILENREKPYL